MHRRRVATAVDVHAAIGGRGRRRRAGARLRDRGARRDPAPQVGGAEAAAGRRGAAACSSCPRAEASRDAVRGPTCARPGSCSGSRWSRRPSGASIVELGTVEPGGGVTFVRTELFGPLDPALYRETVRRALAEDLGWGDVTTEATVLPDQRARGTLLAKRRCVVAGLDVAVEAFRQLDPAVRVEVRRPTEPCARRAT